MEKRSFTIGMAGHIDHGKTTLTKALTHIDTDRLQEEKKRKISIEPGFAPFDLTNNLQVSIIDVPGHERFIRQMIAGVAGIDAVILTVAADEGVMPQTKEHLEILSLLDVKGGLIAVTKSDTVDNEMLQLVGEDIRTEVQGTPFADVEMVFIDSISSRGLEEIRLKLIDILSSLPARNSRGPFRLPVDQVFSVHGQGTIVRGTVYEGSITEGNTVRLLPENHQVRIKQLQIHGKRVEKGVAGQRLALNITGISKDKVKRGDTIVSTEGYLTTNVLNIALYVSKSSQYKLKQRGEVKLHLGTAEVYGNIVFFDRNVLGAADEKVLCQLRLHEPVVTKRGDRFILRRPSPVETIGGGWVIQPQGKKMKFGKETLRHLESELEGTPEDHFIKILEDYKWLTREDLVKYTGIGKEEINMLIERLTNENTVKEFSNGKIYLQHDLETFIKDLRHELAEYHNSHPLRAGKNKEEISVRKGLPSELADRFIEEAVKQSFIIKTNQYISEPAFSPHYPKGWEKRIRQVLKTLEKDRLKVSQWKNYTDDQKIPGELAYELKQYLLQHGKAAAMDQEHIWSTESLKNAANTLRAHFPEAFTLQDAKETLGLSRKFLIPFLEWMDDQKWTKRMDNKRTWRECI